MEFAVRGRRNFSEHPFVRYVRPCGIGDHIESLECARPIREYPKQTLALAARLRADEIRQACLGEMQMQFVGPGLQRNVVLEIALPDMPVNIRIQCSVNPLRWPDNYLS